MRTERLERFWALMVALGLGLGWMSLGLGGCNTARGFGEDMESMGVEIREEIDEEDADDAMDDFEDDLEDEYDD